MSWSYQLFTKLREKSPDSRLVKSLEKIFPLQRVKTPTVLQMEAVECGAAALAIVLGYHGRIMPLEELRIACGVSRDGIRADNILKAARKFGMIAKGYKQEPEDLRKFSLPMIIFWNFNHFVVLEGFGADRFYINDPASGPRVVTTKEFDESFTGVILVFEKGPEFTPAGDKPNLLQSLRKRLIGSESALTYVVWAGLALVIPGLVVPTFTKVFVDEILIGGMDDWLKPLLLGMLITALFRGGLLWLQKYFLLRFEMKLSLSSSSQFFWHVLRLPIEFFQQRFAGEVGSRIAINDKVANLLSGQLASNILDVVMIAFFLILMIQYDVGLTFIGIGIALINILFLRFVARKRIDSSRKLLQDRGKMIGFSMAGLGNIETIKATGGESDFFAQWSGYHTKVINGEQKLGVSSEYLGAVPPLLTTLNNIAILSFGGLRVMNGELSIGMLVAFQSLMASFIGPVNNLVSFGGLLQELEGDMNRLDDVWRYQKDPQFHHIEVNEPDSEQKLRDDESQTKLTGHIELRNVTFGYSKMGEALIKDFNLTLEPGNRVALVGPSGCGKSTVARLVAGLFNPWNGEILFDGKSRYDIPRAVINNSLSMVDQDIFMFEGTIYENLTMWDRTIPESRVHRAARDVGMHEFISTRPNGYESMIEGMGHNFSGGQRQLLEIARALIIDPTILILDEATSALDPKTEKFVDDNLRRRGCTCLIVAHRLSTIRDCDEILVMQGGKVMQRGTHEEMSQEDGPYSRLIKAE
ncbi:MAG: NHLP family bacteriocin export ABC transporter peptidase/permease/ATPase subunit [SAR324 cluster bacterium]|nr:NHLP family bacteriocin export ABC transporter peptidase/permease/ATPase subunit [SAR324 cluster bacterium]